MKYSENKKLNKLLALCVWRFDNHYKATGVDEWAKIANEIVPSALPDNPQFLSYVDRLIDEKLITDAPDIKTDKIATQRGKEFSLEGGFPTTFISHLWYWCKKHPYSSGTLSVNIMYLLFIAAIKVFYCPCVNVIPLPSYQYKSKDTLEAKKLLVIPKKDTIKAFHKYGAKDSLKHN